MKNTFIIITFFAFLISCKNENNQISDNTNKLNQEVIQTILQLDSSYITKNTLISRQLCYYTLDTTIPQKREKHVAPPEVNYKVINPITAISIINLFNKHGVNFNIQEEKNILENQIIESKNKQLDSIVFGYKTIEIKFKKIEDYFRKDSTLVFFTPIYSKNKEYVFVKYHFMKIGKGFILKKENNNWIKISEFNTWSIVKY